jgi:hypothetical protein
MSCVQTRFFQTEGFRLSASYAVAFALSVLVMGVVVVAITDNEFRGQLLRTSRANVAAIQHGYASKGIPEAQEVVNQLTGAPGAAEFFLLQKDNKRIAGNLPVMPPRAGAATLPGSSPDHDILGMGAVVAPASVLCRATKRSPLPVSRAREPYFPVSVELPMMVLASVKPEAVPLRRRGPE